MCSHTSRVYCFCAPCKSYKLSSAAGDRTRFCRVILIALLQKSHKRNDVLMRIIQIWTEFLRVDIVTQSNKIVYEKNCRLRGNGDVLFLSFLKLKICHEKVGSELEKVDENKFYRERKIITFIILDFSKLFREKTRKCCEINNNIIFLRLIQY